MATKISVLIAIVFGLTLDQGAFAQMYKWVDDNGKVHYSDQPSPDPDQQQLDASLSGGTMSTADAYQPSRIEGSSGVSGSSPTARSPSSTIYAGKYRNRMRRNIERLKRDVMHPPYGSTVTRTTVN